MVGKWGSKPPSKGSFANATKPPGTKENPAHDKGAVRGKSQFKDPVKAPSPPSPVPKGSVRPRG